MMEAIVIFSAGSSILTQSTRKKDHLFGKGKQHLGQCFYNEYFSGVLIKTMGEKNERQSHSAWAHGGPR